MTAGGVWPSRRALPACRLLFPAAAVPLLLNNSRVLSSWQENVDFSEINPQPERAVSRPPALGLGQVRAGVGIPMRSKIAASALYLAAGLGFG
jgi:hypothetical protein